MGTETDVKDDFGTFQNNPDKPIFHRLKFGAISFYLTKSSFHNDIATGSNGHGYYRIFSWDDWRSRALLGLELGEDNPRHGPVHLVGSFKPVDGDLRDMQYHSADGRAYYESARAFLEGESEARPPASTNRGDAWSEFRMEEIIPTGVQGKAIYGEGDYIIDGPAGTGKSTTAIQKIKLLTRNSGVDAARILVVVRTSQLRHEFKQLLLLLDLPEIRVATLDEVRLEIGLEEESMSELDLEDILRLSEAVCSVLASLDEELERFSRGIFGQPGLQLPEAASAFENDRRAHELLENYQTVRSDLLVFYRAQKEELRTRSAKLSEQVESFKIKMLEGAFRRRMSRLGEKTVEVPPDDQIEEQLSFDESNKVQRRVAERQTALESSLTKWRKSVSERLARRKSRLDELVGQVRSRITEDGFSEAYFDDGHESTLLNLHIKRVLGNPEAYHTVVLDEAQNVPGLDIHLLWLQSQNLILTGDEMQSDVPGGLGVWASLGAIKQSFVDEGQLKIFTLQNNFRQTFELGSCSHNFRQLTLGRPIEDISAEYFENQKGFPRPKIARIRRQEDFVDLVEDKLRLASEVFSNPPPVVLLYENQASLERLTNVLQAAGIGFGRDADEDRPVMLVSISAIAGRSFPIVLSPLLPNSSDQTLYVMLSRARFDLTFFVGEGRPLSKKFSSLLGAGLIEDYEYG